MSLGHRHWLVYCKESKQKGKRKKQTKPKNTHLLQCAGLEEGHFAGVKIVIAGTFG